MREGACFLIEYVLERDTGIEPVSQPWEGRILTTIRIPRHRYFLLYSPLRYMRTLLLSMLFSGLLLLISSPAFAQEQKEVVGTASWYASKRYPDGAATNLFPMGTILKVTNTKTGAHTLVRVTSRWTQTDKRRVVDLVKTAFSKIGNLSDGLVRVKIEKVKSKNT